MRFIIFLIDGILYQTALVQSLLMDYSLVEFESGNSVVFTKIVYLKLLVGMPEAFSWHIREVIIDILFLHGA